MKSKRVFLIVGILLLLTLVIPGTSTFAGGTNPG